ncbi:MAG: hypothetical protein KDB00_05465, partial [Planctomycetales bacterium]|nr:hypothetical protein [Planctomycetales bacterium]
MYKPWSFLSALVCAGIVMMAHGVSADPPVQSTSAVATPAEQNAARLAQKNAVQWTIRDADGRPIPDASVDVYLWNGHYQHLGLSAVSNHEGIATIEGISQNGFSYARIGKAGFVADMMELVINSNRERLQTITLQSPVRSTIEVCDANGMPIAGAELTWLQYTSNNGNANVLTKSAASDLGLTWGKSDANGVLELPPLPLDVALKLTIFHPDYVSQSFSELRVRSGLLSAATLNQGVRMEIKLRHQDGSVVKDGAPMEVVLFPQTGSINESGIRHQINVRDGKLSMTVQPKNFNELRVRSEDFYVGPMLHNFLDRPNPILDLSDGESAAIELTAYPKRKLSGRVVDAEGNPKPGVHVSAMLVSPDPEHASRSFESIKELGLEQATALEGADTDKDGRYELEVTGGTVQLEVIATGFYSVPETTLLAVTDVEPAVADDIVLLPVPVLTGVVVDPDGEPMPGMICKVVSDGFGDALPVKASGPAGKFRLALSRIPYRRDAGGLDYVAYVMAFHPGKLLGGITQVDLRKPQ